MSDEEIEIVEIVNRETKAWNNQDVDLLISIFHPDMVWPWPRASQSHDPIDWEMTLGRFNKERWSKGWQNLFDNYRLVHNNRKIRKIAISNEKDGALAVVDVDTLWVDKDNNRNHWKGRVCKVYSKVGAEWKMTMHTGVLEYKESIKQETNTQEVSHIKRREIQAPIVSAIIAGFIKEFGKTRTLEIVTKVIEKDAIDSGRLLAEKFKGNSMIVLAKLIREVWCDQGAMVIDVLKENENEFHFNVTECKYAKVYKELEVLELGKCLSCERDISFNEGFNPEIKLERTQTIMEEASHCNFRYSKK